METSIIISIVTGAIFLVVTIVVILVFFFYKNFVFDRKQKQILHNNRLKASKTLNQLKANNKVVFNNRLKSIAEKEKIRKLAYDNKIGLLKEKERNLNEKNDTLLQWEKKLNGLNEENKIQTAQLNKNREEMISKLEEVANITEKEAKEQLFSNIEKREIKSLNKLTRDIKNRAENNLKQIVSNILANAIERFASEYVEERLTSAILLNNDDIKGKIIGKEGRNIKSFETKSGTDLIIEKDSNVIKVSSFNPIRREIAVQALASLIKDGRIQPQRIEETLKKEGKNIENIIRENGQNTVEKLGITNIDSKLVYHVGMLKYRTSFGQNVLLHSIEVAKIAGALAKELKLDDEIAVRAGLLHDIGKSIDYEVGESHVEAGVRLAQKYNESKIIINAIHSHHGDIPPDNVYSVLISAADTISAARPGARDNVHEDYLKRMETIEKICNSIDGIKKSYAIKSGRVIRVVVDPLTISDYEAENIGKKIKEQVKAEIQIPGEMKIIVIREKRFEDIIS